MHVEDDKEGEKMRKMNLVYKERKNRALSNLESDCQGGKGQTEN